MSSVAPDGAPPPWKPWAAPVALFAAFAFAVFGGLVVGLVGAIFGARLEEPPPAVDLAATLVQDGAFVGAALAFGGGAATVTAARLGLRPVSVRRALGWMVLAFVAYLAISFAWITLLDLDRPDDDVLEQLGAESSTAALIASCVLVTVIAPIAEELFFRGFFFGALRNWRGPWVAAVLTGLVFGAIHGTSTPAGFLVPLAVLGFLLCIVRWRSGSLLPCVALHAINNVLAFDSSQDLLAWQLLALLVGAVGVSLLVLRPFLAREPVGRALN